MALNVEDDAQIARECETANNIFKKLKETYFSDDEMFQIRSWGMSDDYPIAIKYGSNMIRIGSKIFGPRVY